MADGVPTVGWGKTFCHVGGSPSQKWPELRNKKSKNRSEGAKSTVSPRATNAINENWGLIAKKRIFEPKSENLGPKKDPLLMPNHVPATIGQCCPKKKVFFSQMINRHLINVLGFGGVYIE